MGKLSKDWQKPIDDEYDVGYLDGRHVDTVPHYLSRGFSYRQGFTAGRADRMAAAQKVARAKAVVYRRMGGYREGTN